jgi:hypothetical protein
MHPRAGTVVSRIGGTGADEKRATYLLAMSPGANAVQAPREDAKAIAGAPKDMAATTAA